MILTALLLVSQLTYAAAEVTRLSREQAQTRVEKSQQNRIF